MLGNPTNTGLPPKQNHRCHRGPTGGAASARRFTAGIVRVIAGANLIVCGGVELRAWGEFQLCVAPRNTVGMIGLRYLRLLDVTANEKIWYDARASSVALKTFGKSSLLYISWSAKVFNFLIVLINAHAHNRVLVDEGTRGAMPISIFEKTILIQGCQKIWNSGWAPIKPSSKSGGALCYQATKKWRCTYPQAPHMVTPL